MLKGSKKENGKVKRVYLRTTSDEYNMILNDSKKSNMTMSEYLLFLVKENNKKIK